MEIEDLIAEGQRLLSQMKFEEAAAAFDAAVAADPANPVLLASRGAGLIALGRYDEAFADFDRAVALAPDNPRLYYRRGMAYDSLGREKESQEDLRRSWVLGQARLQGELDTYGIIRTEMDKPR
jgi:tetratricopeptide (TPR) repeat protein